MACRTAFNAECNGIVINRRDLDRPRHSTMQQVEQSILLLLQLLPSELANIRTCSDMLASTVRTLQRNLDAAGTNFSELPNPARACSYRRLTSPIVQR
jgi:hypothetical protein